MWIVTLLSRWLYFQKKGRGLVLVLVLGFMGLGGMFWSGRDVLDDKGEGRRKEGRGEVRERRSEKECRREGERHVGGGGRERVEIVYRKE
jgi:hypothetical protein